MNIIIIGPAGKMGRLITKKAYERSDMNIVSGVAPKGRDYIGKDLGIVTAIGTEIGAIVVDDLESVIEKCDLIIDYTIPKCSMEVMETALRYNKAVVCGTTGFTKDELNRIKEISKKIPVGYDTNSSRIVNLMYKLLEITTKALGNVADIEIIEMHDKNKKDAPSGTSKEIGRVIAEALDKELEDLAVFGREGERTPGSIGYHSVRAGDISSSHTVMFGLIGERLEITHHTHNWECFAQGACDAAAYLYRNGPGIYTVKEMLDLD